MTLPVNSNQLKWSRAQFEIEGELEHDDVTVTLRGAITKIGYEDLNDGTYDRIHTLVPKYVEVVKSNGEAVKGTDKRKQSQLLKGQIEHLRREFSPTADEEDFYNQAMQAIRHEASQVLKTHNLI
jgi:hypothetical protein